MTAYADALRALEARVPGRIEPDLTRIASLCELLGDPEQAYPSIHVTGTNGKTSVARMVTALLGAIGLRAGTYTSPHLQTVRERMSIAGEPITAEVFAEVFGTVDLLALQVDQGAAVRVTYFELLTAMAYAWFAEEAIDVGVFEVGMGGRWDATNLVRGESAAIVSIGLDHPELGSTPAEVAWEKAGIVKPDASVVCGPVEDDVRAVIAAEALARDASVLWSGEDVGCDERVRAVDGQLLTLRTPTRTYPEVYVPLHGLHQADNAAVALGAVHGLLGSLEAVDDEVVRAGFAAVTVPGRLEVVSRQPSVVLDGAHNPAGAQRAAEAMGEAFRFRDLILVIACLADKDVEGIVAPFRGVASHVVVTAAPSERAASVDQMAAVAASVWAGTKVVIETAPDVATAVSQATGVAGSDDGVLVTGSLYTVGAARDVYRPVTDEIE